MERVSDQAIFQSVPLKIQGCEFSSYASNASSIYLAREVIALVHRSTRDDYCPFAFRVIEDGILHEIHEDCGEFYCGKILLQTMQTLGITNLVIIASKKVKGCFVTDMIQQSKLVAVKKSAQAAAQLLMDARVAEESSKLESISSLQSSSVSEHVTFQLNTREEHVDIAPQGMRKEVVPKAVVNIDWSGLDSIVTRPKKGGRPGVKR